jgi:hypothetical protein
MRRGELSFEPGRIPTSYPNRAFNDDGGLMNATTQTLRDTLADARRLAQTRGKEVICELGGEQTTAPPGDGSGPISRNPHRLVAIVRPDEPIVYCGLLPS